MSATGSRRRAPAPDAAGLVAFGPLLEGRSAGVRALALASRALLLRLVPHATERPRPGWGLLGFDAPHYFAFVAPQEDHVRLGFEHGVLLDDPAGLLRGEGRQVRHVEVRAPGDLEHPALALLVAQAAEPRAAARVVRRPGR